MGESRVQIKVEPSGLKATVRIVRGTAMAPGELRNAITVAGITTGLDDDSISRLAELLEDPEGACRDTVIATGQPPRDGDDGRFELVVESHHVIGTARADGSLDFRTRNMVTNILDRELVARYAPPTPGTPGRTVRGKPLAAHGGNDTLPEAGAFQRHRTQEGAHRQQRRFRHPPLGPQLRSGRHRPIDATELCRRLGIGRPGGADEGQPRFNPLIIVPVTATAGGEWQLTAPIAGATPIGTSVVAQALWRNTNCCITMTNGLQITLRKWVPEATTSTGGVYR